MECVAVYRKLSEISQVIYAICAMHRLLEDDIGAFHESGAGIIFRMSMYAIEERFWYGHCFEDQRGTWG